MQDPDDRDNRDIVSRTYRISPEGERITLQTRFENGDLREVVYFRQR